MKKLILPLVILLIVGVGASASENLKAVVKVEVHVEAFAQILSEANELELKIDFSDDTGFGKRVQSIPITIAANHDLVLTLQSVGFRPLNSSGDTVEELNKLVWYKLGDIEIQAGANSATTIKKSLSALNQGQHTVDLSAIFSPNGEAQNTWYQIPSGIYQDTVTITAAVAN